MFLLYHLLPLFLIILWQLWRHYIKFTRYVLDIVGGLHVLCVPDVTIVLTFPSLFLHDTWLICSYCTQCTNVSHSSIKTRFLIDTLVYLFPLFQLFLMLLLFLTSNSITLVFTWYCKLFICSLCTKCYHCSKLLFIILTWHLVNMFWLYLMYQSFW